MTLYVIDPSNPLPPVYGEGEAALTIGDGDTVILGHGAEIAAYGRNGWGLFGGVGNNLIINGSIHSEWETAIAAHGTITIGISGRVYGRDVGLQLGNDPFLERPSILNNAGHISTGEDGVAIWLHGASNTIVNSGEIRGAGGIWSYNDQAEGGTFTLYNSGVISASDQHAIAAALFGSNYIVNTGHIDGAIILGSGDDYYDGRDGTWSRGSADIRLREGNDVFYGGISQEFIHADEGNDTVDGGGGDDRLMGGAGDDLLRGGSGNDDLRGGAGTDVAVFSGSFWNYDIVRQADGTYTVSDHTDGTGSDGMDVLRNIEYLQFADLTIALEGATNSAPTSISLSSRLIDGDALAGAVVGTLSGIDSDGDALGFHLASNPGGHFRIHGNKIVVDRPFTDRDADITIVVRASDPHGAFIDGTFVIEVDPDLIRIPPGEITDVFEFPVEEAPETVEEPGSSPPPIAPLTRIGGKKADVLKGGTGADLLNGSLGKDKLIGGEGQDTFVFSTKLGPKNVDRIVDFNHADDTIRLSKAIFSKIQKGVLSKDAFWVGAKAHDKSDRIIYNKKTGDLLYDADGSGTKYKAAKFAQLKAKTLVKADDFFIV